MISVHKSRKGKREVIAEPTILIRRVNLCVLIEEFRRRACGKSTPNPASRDNHGGLSNHPIARDHGAVVPTACRLLVRSKF